MAVKILSVIEKLPSLIKNGYIGGITAHDVRFFLHTGGIYLPALKAGSDDYLTTDFIRTATTAFIPNTNRRRAWRQTKMELLL